MPRGVYERTDEARKNIGIASKGRKHSDASKLRRSIAQAGENGPMYGHHHTEEAKKKIGENSSWRNQGTGKGSTAAEDRFAKLHPDFEQEVSFGTGKGGGKIWGTCHWIADFYDRRNNIIYEIDGSSHNTEYIKKRDKRKDEFFKSIGIEVVRIKNKDVGNE